MVERPLMVRWVVGSILHGEPIELFLVIASVPRLVLPRLVLPRLEVVEGHMLLTMSLSPVL